jgi:hypothetical protein
MILDELHNTSVEIIETCIISNVVKLMFQQCYSKLLPQGVISVELYFYSIVSVMGVPVSSDEKVAFPIRLKRAAPTGFEMAEKGILFPKVLVLCTFV